MDGRIASRPIEDNSLNPAPDADTAADAKGGCFGFEVRSPLSFEYLRTSGDEPLYVSERETEFDGPPGDFLYADGYPNRGMPILRY